MDLGLEDKIVIVTGAGSGIGAAIARAFCKERAKTIFVDIDIDGLQKAVRGGEPFGSIQRCDVTDRKQVKKFFQEIEKKHGALHVLVNNAAVNSAQFIEDITEEECDQVISVNIKGYVNTTTAALPLMKKAGYGRLIYINSGSGLKASAGLPLYSGSKYFNRGFAISAALEVGKYNITSNSICPSDIYPSDIYPPDFSLPDSSPQDSSPQDFSPQVPPTDEELGPKSWKTESLVRITLEKEGVASLKELITKRTQANPMRRTCTREDVANLALFLASERAGFINGQSIGVNGGVLPY